MEKRNSLHRNKDFNILYINNFIASFSNNVYIFTLPLFVYFWTKSALSMNIVRAMDLIPIVLLGLLIGVLIDRVNRKRILQLTVLFQSILVTILFFLVWTGVFEIFYLYILAFCIGITDYTYNATRQAIVPQLFEATDLTEIQSKFSFINTFFSILGPSLGGLIIIWLDYKWIFLAYALLFILIFINTSFLSPVKGNLNRDKKSIWEDIKEGIKELISIKSLIMPTIVIITINFSTSLIIGVIIFYVVDTLGSSTKEVGWMFSISALGGLLGVKLLKILRKKYTRSTIFSTVLSIDVLTLILLFFAQNWWQIGILLAVRSSTTIIINIIYISVRQEITPNHLLGRVSGAISMITRTVTPLGLLFSGVWADNLSIPPIFLISSVIMFVLSFYIRRSTFKSIQ